MFLFEYPSELCSSATWYSQQVCIDLVDQLPFGLSSVFDLLATFPVHCHTLRGAVERNRCFLCTVQFPVVTFLNLISRNFERSFFGCFRN